MRAIALMLLAVPPTAADPQPALRPPDALETGAPVDASPLGADLPNFGKAHAWLYRGAQPSETGFKILDELGIHTVVNLRNSTELAEKEGEIVRGLGMRYVHVPMHELKTPEDADVDRFLRLAADYRTYPIFVHCRRGSDRTGALMASYRISIDGWGLQRTLKEALEFKILSPAHMKFILDYYQGEHPPSEDAVERIGPVLTTPAR